MLKSGKLRSIIIFERPVFSQKDDGSVEEGFIYVFKCYANIEPLSVKELILANTTEHKITCRIVVRYNKDIMSDWRIRHGEKIYVIDGIQQDPDSGIEYLTIAASGGVVNESAGT